MSVSVDPKGGKNELTFLQFRDYETDELIDSIPSNAIPDIEDLIQFGEMSGVGIEGLGDMEVHAEEFDEQTYVVADRTFTYIRLDVTEEMTGGTTEALINNVDIFLMPAEEYDELQTE